MKLKLAGRQVALVAMVAAALTFASGCSSDKGGTSSSEYSTSTQTSSSGETKAVIPLYKESMDVGKMEVDAGTVRVKKVVKTETVNQPVELRHVEIEIERVPPSASDEASPDSAFKEQETVIHLTREEPVIQKRTTSAGRVVLQTHSESMQTNIQGTLRSEDVNIKKSGDVAMTQSSQSSGGAESPSSMASGQSSGDTINPPTYSSVDASGKEGNAVQYSNRKVLSVTGDQLTCIDVGGGHPMYVYSKYGASRLKPGDYVSVTGIMRTSVSDMKGATAQFLGSQSSYVYAKTIDRANR